MPNSVSAKKRLRQSLVRRDRNRALRSSLRTQLRKLRAAITAGDVAACETEFRVSVKKLDQAAAKKVVHANTAARLKSRFSRAVKALKAPKTATV
jgi:small subunit ribosomal protein S20